jgi:predicted regulator of Ras-like GTPase activity (Roadblock/LC7/MglB family)
MITVGEVTRLLDSLVDRVDSVDQAVVLSRDGLVVAASGLGREDSEHLSALVAGVQGLARGACRHFDGGEVLQSVIEMDSVFLFVVTAGEDTCLAVLSPADADAGVIAYEMAELAERLSGYLSADPQLSDQGSGVG